MAWKNFHRVIIFVFSAFLLLPGSSLANPSLTLLSTSTTDNSGILAHLLTRFKNETGIQVYVVATGTGQAIRAATKGDGDLLIVHDKDAELAFIESGIGLNRREFMFNDFILVGPQKDPARVLGSGDIYSAFRKIYDQRKTNQPVIFLSRGDDSGTHKRELMLWYQLGIGDYNDLGITYRETGAGMGKTLNIAAAMNAYTLVDRGTWLSFNNRQDLAILMEGGNELFNQYSVIEINPVVHPHVKAELARQLSDWLIGQDGQKAIDEFKISGKNLFYPNFKRPVIAN